jgi:hypothetical protein
MPETLYKIFPITKQTSEDENTAIAVISTDSVDRDREVLLPKGMLFENWLKRPTVTWAHNYGAFPIGKGYWIKAGRKAIKAKWEWAPTAFAQEARLLWENDFLGAASVGFDPLEPPRALTPAEIQKRPEWANARRVYPLWDLLEFAVVPVPSNPDARKRAIKAKGLELSSEMWEALGLETEKTHYTSAHPDITKEQGESEEPNPAPAIKEPAEIETDEPYAPVIKTAPFILTDPVIRTQPDMRGVAAEVVAETLKKLKGRMF